MKLSEFFKTDECAPVKSGDIVTCERIFTNKYVAVQHPTEDAITLVPLDDDSCSITWIYGDVTTADIIDTYGYVSCKNISRTPEPKLLSSGTFICHEYKRVILAICRQAEVGTWSLMNTFTGSTERIIHSSERECSQQMLKELGVDINKFILLSVE